MSFNPEWRDNAIETLVSDDIDTILTAKGEYNDEFFLSEILTGGFKGYANHTDEELERMSELLFDLGIIAQKIIIEYND